MVHVLQGNPQSPSLLSTKAVCQFTDLNSTLAVSGLLPGQQPFNTPQNQAMLNSCFLNFLPTLTDSLLSHDAWLAGVTFTNQCKPNFSPVFPITNVNTNLQESTIRQTGTRHTPSSISQTTLSDDKPSSANQELSNDDSFHIFVGDLAPDIEGDVLLAAFNTFGNVTECKIIKDMHTQKPKGYGFVAYKSREEAERAIQVMNGQVLGSRAIRTNWAVRRDPADQAKDHRPLNYVEVFNASSASNTTIYVGGITSGLTELLLQNAFQEFGEIKEIRIFKEKGFSFIRFDSHAAATRAIVTMHGRLVGDQSCKCSWGKEPTYSSRMNNLATNPPWSSCVSLNTEPSMANFTSASKLSYTSEAVNRMTNRPDLVYDLANSASLRTTSTLRPTTSPQLVAERYWPSNCYLNDADATLPNLLIDPNSPVSLTNGKSSLANPLIQTTLGLTDSNCQQPGPMSCEMTAPLLTDALPVTISTLPGMKSGLMTVRHLGDRPFFQPYITPCPVTPGFPLMSPAPLPRFGMSENPVHPAFPVAGFQQYGLTLRGQTILPVSLPTSDLLQTSTYGCGFLPSDNIPRTTFMPNLNGVSLLC
ncbi:hypothetical protein CRM22_010145 [Opisthorchis felineus]|uniref:RRM domain-containing protein n=1 Tax=Opisthorchis felineus TaxID=147828 RepID=A0A4S2L1P3_OPIFE|nr:hypothetical protein CRM22_010145 [Opisthorchis felineus]